MPSGAGYKNMIQLFPEIQEIQKENIITKSALNKMIAMVRGSDYHILSNMEDVTDWDISNASVFNAENDTTDIRVGSNCIKLIDIGATKGDFVTLDLVHRPEREDWGMMNWLCMWVHDETGLRLAGELTIQIRNNLEWGAEIAVPLNQTVDAYEYKCINIQALARDNVDGFRFVNQRGSGGSEAVFVDEIIVTNFITGVGNGNSVATGPVLGAKIVPIPVLSGQTIVPGDCVSMDSMGVSTSAADDFNIIGIAGQFEAIDSVVASDIAPKEVWVVVSGQVLLRNDDTGMAQGEHGKLGSDVVSKGAGAGTSDAEKDFCISNETATTAAWKIGDTSYQLSNSGTEN